MDFDFNKKPFLVIWETTHACDLACVHCRAKADPLPDPTELSTNEGLRLIGQVKQMGTPILVFSGGDPLKRKDLLDLVFYAKSLGLRTGVIPAVTPLLTKKVIKNLKDNGLDQIAFSLDAADAGEHDAFRKTKGVFEHTLEAVRWAHEADLAVQINSLVNVHNLEKFDDLIALVETLDIVFWEIFFLVPVGRGEQLPLLDASGFDRAFERIYELSLRRKFVIKVTEAPHYKRFMHEKEKLASVAGPANGRGAPMHSRIGLAPQAVNAGKGFVFVSHKGEVFPSGFLPLRAGNVRERSLQDIYQNAPVLKNLRDVSLLRGRCGRCFFKEQCGGSRSRAYALTGDYLAEDPCCSFSLS